MFGLRRQKRNGQNLKVLIAKLTTRLSVKCIGVFPFWNNLKHVKGFVKTCSHVFRLEISEFLPPSMRVQGKSYKFFSLQLLCFPYKSEMWPN